MASLKIISSFGILFFAVCGLTANDDEFKCRKTNNLYLDFSNYSNSFYFFYHDFDSFEQIHAGCDMARTLSAVSIIWTQMISRYLPNDYVILSKTLDYRINQTSSVAAAYSINLSKLKGFSATTVPIIFFEAGAFYSFVVIQRIHLRLFLNASGSEP